MVSRSNDRAESGRAARAMTRTIIDTVQLITYNDLMALIMLSRYRASRMRRSAALIPSAEVVETHERSGDY
jgi:hypothetical protein